MPMTDRLSPGLYRKASAMTWRRRTALALAIMLPLGLSACQVPQSGPISWINDIADEVIPGRGTARPVTPARPGQTAPQAPAQPTPPPAARLPASPAQAPVAPASVPAQVPGPAQSTPPQLPTVATVPQPAPVTTDALPPPSVATPAATPGEPVLQLRPPGDQAGIRIGLLLPLSGANAAIGRAMLDAAQMAIFDINDVRITMLPRDVGEKAEDAVAAAQDLLAAGADVIVGPLLAASVQAVAPIARARGIAVLSFSSDRNVAGPGTYILGFTPDQQIERVVAFAKARGISRIGALAPETAYGQLVMGALRTSTARHQIALGRSETYPADTADLTPIARKFATAELRRAENEPGIDALLLPEGGAKLRALAPLLPYFDLDPRRVKFLGTGLWDDSSIGAESALVGGWFASPDPSGFIEFRQRFEATYGRRPPRIASIAYDAVALAGVLGRDYGAKAFLPESIGNPDGFTGYDGLFRFRPDGVVERGLAIIEVQARGLRTIDPAPTSFIPKTN